MTGTNGQMTDELVRELINDGVENLRAAYGKRDADYIVVYKIIHSTLRKLVENGVEVTE